MKSFSINKQPSDVLKELATWEKSLRKKHGFTQSEMARRSDVSLGSLKRFEQTGEINLASLLKLLKC